MPNTFLQLVRELPNVGGDAKKVGYYTGIIVRIWQTLWQWILTKLQMSMHFVAAAATSFQWNRLSDHIGRKPVLLFCLAGVALSILLFGLSHSFWALVLRCFLRAHAQLRGTPTNSRLTADACTVR